ncbi:uncharacterized protein [Watersipora subatra]|uniref:uncharacterized protein n=1 Tax=Watersipora subatra TaxID=2589382 RepID=UPI00355B2862
MFISAGGKTAPVRLTASAGGPKPTKQNTNKSRLRGSSSAKPGLLSVTPKLTTGESAKHARRLRQERSSPPEPEEEVQVVMPPPKPAWSQFEDHVKVVARSDLFLGEKKEAYSKMCSQDHQKTMTEIRKLSLKRQVKKVKAKVSTVNSLKTVKTSDESTDEIDKERETSEDEETKEKGEKNRERARYHWEILRRYIDDRIRERRKKKGGFNTGKAFNKLRAQAKVTLNPDQTRRDIFYRYGIIARPGKLYPENIMKPVFSTRARDIIAKFEQVRVISIVPMEIKHHGYSHMRQKEKILPRSRPATTSPTRRRRFF